MWLKHASVSDPLYCIHVFGPLTFGWWTVFIYISDVKLKTSAWTHVKCRADVTPTPCSGPSTFDLCLGCIKTLSPADWTRLTSPLVETWILPVWFLPPPPFLLHIVVTCIGASWLVVLCPAGQEWRHEQRGGEEGERQVDSCCAATVLRIFLSENCSIRHNTPIFFICC